MLTVVPGEGSGREGGKDGSPSLIDEIVREGARRMLAEALQAEVDAYIAAFAAERDENGRRLVVRNGYHQSREVLTGAGAVEVTVPRVNDKRTDRATGERVRLALLRWAIPGQRRVLACLPRSDCQSELVEDRAEPVAGGDVGGDVVVAAAQVLHEGMTGGEDPR
jgi:hypothetical protein